MMNKRKMRAIQPVKDFSDLAGQLSQSMKIINTEYDNIIIAF